jgi:NCS1 family nucleobase:cation symporter-1
MWEALACTFDGQILIAIVITLNGRAGAVYHVGFPILNRCAYGLYGASWSVNSAKLDLAVGLT